MVKDTELQASTMAAKARFEEKVNKKTGPLMPNMGNRCWQWLGKSDKNGYGSFGMEVGGKRLRTAHTCAWVLYGQPPPLPGVHIHHACKNPLCVNPHHFQVITVTQHKRLRYAIITTTCPNGHPFNNDDPLIDGAGYRRCRVCATVCRTRYDYVMAEADRVKVEKLIAKHGTSGLARLLGVDHTAVSNWIYGLRRPTKKNMARIDELYDQLP